VRDARFNLAAISSPPSPTGSGPSATGKLAPRGAVHYLLEQRGEETERYTRGMSELLVAQRFYGLSARHEKRVAGNRCESDDQGEHARRQEGQ
jgi:hypothetical protein